MLNKKGLFSAFFYGVCSTSMAFINKVLMDTFDFNYPCFIMSCQMVFTIGILEGLRYLNKVDIPSLSVSRVLMFLPPAFFYGVNCTLSLIALSSMNIPMYGVIKRCAPLAILLLGVCILKKGLPSWKISVAIGSMTIGCIIAGYGDLTFDLEAYGCGIASVFSQALYLILLQKVSQNKLSVGETMHLNSYITLPLLVVFSIFLREPTNALLVLRAPPVGLLVIFLFVVSMGCVLNYSLFLCTTENSALTTSIVGCIKSVMQTAIGMFTFGGLGINFFTATGVTMNVMGGIFYSFAKYQEGNKGNDKDKEENVENGIKKSISNGVPNGVEKC